MRCFRKILFAATCATTLATGHAAPIKFDVPAQPAAKALAALAKQAEVEVLFSFDELRTVRANAVVGVYEPDAALALLLRGTGFVASHTAPRKYVVVREPVSQGAEVRGVVVVRSSGGPLAGARVRVAGSAVEARTSADGSFVLHEVPVDTPGIVVQAEGFTALRVANLGLRAGRLVELGTMRMMANTGPEELEEMVVNASDLGDGGPAMFALQRMVVTPSRFGIDQERGSLAATLTEKDLQALPQLGEDLYRAISHLPGLAADDYTAQFWVRGAPHQQLLARLDGVELIEPFHLKDTDSSLSILDLESIGHLDLFTGGFTSEFGDHTGGVLVMETDSPVRGEPRTSLGLSLTGAHVGTRGQAKDGRSRWLFSARAGYPDLALDDSTDGTKLKMRYYDVAGKMEFNLTPNHTLSLHALHAGDTGHYSDRLGPVLTSRYDSDYLWARWQGNFGPRLTGEAVLSGTRLTWQRDGAGRIDNNFAASVHDKRELDVLALRQDWTASVSERVLLRGGLEFKSGEADYDYQGSREIFVLRNGTLQRQTITRTAQINPDGETFGSYLTARTQLLPSLTLEAGLRYDTDDYAKDSDVSPRLNAAWSRGRTTLRAAWGSYHQAQGLHELAASDGDTVFRRSERAEHRVLSVEQRLESGINLRLEAYERRVSRPRPHWENVVDNLDAFPELESDRVQLVPKTARARGIELIAERRIGGKFSWSGSYAFARTEETLVSGQTIPRARDQRHTFYFDLTYAPNPRWQFSLAAQYHTGWPITDLTFSRIALANGGTSFSSQLGPIYGTRLPSYQRLDLRAQRRFRLKHSDLRVYVDVFNALDRENTIGYNYSFDPATNPLVVTRTEGEQQVSRLPSLGLTWDF